MGKGKRKRRSLRSYGTVHAAQQPDGAKVLDGILQNATDDIDSETVGKLAEAAAANFTSGAQIMAVLIRRLGKKLIISDSVVEITARSRGSGEDIMSFLLKFPSAPIPDGAESTSWHQRLPISPLYSR
ncbi:uncharacterized protein BO97DRAFT_454965 [Aspergillus homomorphus CBS 101889]|uniref:Uncharacterized protein n=1 Tax=Aspergillus homomorphus (strain CBS 101889) TaxID=1450537 RepID=A0A395HTL3_ASPHC|nr:hypothetical protein BO97DRAFT_454965 [Aspergillus homomorphus CBS 101889]RAL10839.1 hypothetical protein BO97DRAFT_454965 [Aspergillus homomorphus CBS 101889]